MNTPITPKYTLQIFVYNTEGINNDNNFPILGFSNLEHLYNFFENLKGTDLPDDKNGWFVINNLHLLPELCVKKLNGYNEFNILDNIQILKSVYIADNNVKNSTNTDENIGFSTILSNIDMKSRLSIDSEVYGICFCSIQ